MVMNSIRNVLGSLTFLLILSACSSAPKTEILEVKTVPVERPALVLPPADKINMKDIQWIIVTPENQEKVFLDLKEKGKPVSLFSLTGEQYTNISQNLNDLRRYIEQQSAIIVAYENYYVKANQALENAVKVD